MGRCHPNQDCYFICDRCSYAQDYGSHPNTVEGIGEWVCDTCISTLEWLAYNESERVKIVAVFNALDVIRSILPFQDQVKVAALRTILVGLIGEPEPAAVPSPEPPAAPPPCQQCGVPDVGPDGCLCARVPSCSTCGDTGGIWEQTGSGEPELSPCPDCVAPESSTKGTPP